MLKYAIVLLVLSFLAGAMGLTRVSSLVRRLSFTLFALFFLGFVALIGLAMLVDDAMRVP